MSFDYKIGDWLARFYHPLLIHVMVADRIPLLQVEVVVVEEEDW